MENLQNPLRNTFDDHGAYPLAPVPLAENEEASAWWKKRGARFEPSAKLLEELELRNLASSLRACFPPALAVTP